MTHSSRLFQSSLYFEMKCEIHLIWCDFCQIALIFKDKATKGVLNKQKMNKHIITTCKVDEAFNTTKSEKGQICKMNVHQHLN